jgi:GNAT superfamily N-acetyltransferase
MQYLRDRGARWVNVSGYGPAYLTPGIDVDASPEGVSLFRKLGFDEVEAPVSMRLDLADYVHSDGSLAAAAVADGFTFAPCGAGDLPEVIRFAAEVTGGDWGVVLRDSVIRHGAPDRIRIARSPDGAIVGFATFGSYEGVLGRFGPFGVDPAFRGRDLGKILLHDTLGAMKARGVPSAWFLWTDPESPAGRLYAQLGFTVVRRFSVVQRDL